MGHPVPGFVHPPVSATWQHPGHRLGTNGTGRLTPWRRSRARRPEQLAGVVRDDRLALDDHVGPDRGQRCAAHDEPRAPAVAHGQQWVVNAYVLALAALVALGGKLGDRFGGVTTFRLGVTVFFVASLGCGFAPHGPLGEPWIIAFRVLQGAGAALMTPASATIVTNAFPAATRGRAMAVSPASAGLPGRGPLIGGVLTEAVSWRTVSGSTSGRPGRSRAGARGPPGERPVAGGHRPRGVGGAAGPGRGDDRAGRAQAPRGVGTPRQPCSAWPPASRCPPSS